MTVTKAAIVGIQNGDEDWDERPGTILITSDLNGRVYFERENISVAIDLKDLMDALTQYICEGQHPGGEQHEYH